MDQKIFNLDLLQHLYAAVDALPKEAIETAKKEITRKGYDTTGYQYQYLINVLNEVVTPSMWSFDYTVMKEEKGTWGNGKSFWEITVEMTIEIMGTKRKCVGGHRAEMHSDTLKGAITNSLKKTLGMFGVGKKAYEGTIDEDYRPVPVAGENKFTTANMNAILACKTIDELRTHYEANTGLGADFAKAVTEKKKQLMEITEEDIADVDKIAEEKSRTSKRTLVIPA